MKVPHVGVMVEGQKEKESLGLAYFAIKFVFFFASQAIIIFSNFCSCRPDCVREQTSMGVDLIKFRCLLK